MEPRSGEHTGVLVAANVVALIDILFVVPIILMAFSPLRSSGLSAVSKTTAKTGSSAAAPIPRVAAMCLQMKENFACNATFGTEF